jgi:hypothetical protein
LFGATLVLLAVLVVLAENTKTDQTLGRSVALLAQLHPKCPFQVEASARPSVLDGMCSTEVLRNGPDYRNTVPHRSIRMCTYQHRLERLDRQRVEAELALGSGVVSVLLRGGGVSARLSVESD